MAGEHFPHQCLRGLRADFDVKTYGAKTDGKTPDRDSINKAIEAASSAGGGTVNFPAGAYLTGSIRLRSNITLRLEPGARIEDFSVNDTKLPKADHKEF